VASCKHAENKPNAAHRRVALTSAYLKVICPEIDGSTRTKLVGSILSLIDRRDRPLCRNQITDAQAVEMVWRHSQCVRNQCGRCPLLVFGRQLADEVNSYFSEEE
jgi:hypothetical protein